MKKEHRADLRQGHLENGKAMTLEEKQLAEKTFLEIVDNLEKQNLPDIHLLRGAYKYALGLHEEHRRLNGEPYIMHDLGVAKILTEVGYESHLIASAILHDVINRCGVSVEELEHKFGAIVADTVRAVSRVSESLAEEQDIEKKDMEILSDVKFLKELQNNNRRAFYIKLADTIHNMRTIDALPEEVRVHETKHVRNILIPVAKKIHVFKLVDILETLCLKVENPIAFQTIREGYRRLLDENRDTILGLKDFWRNLFLNEKNVYLNYVVDLIFVERFEDSIFRHLTEHISNMNDLPSYINKKNIPLYDINFVVNEAYEGNPQDIFMKYYPELYHSRYRVTIVGFGYTKGTEAFFYKLVDRYGNHYRLFVQKKLELLRYSHGILSDSLDVGRGQNVYINEAEPDEPEHKQIQVYRKDGRAMLIDEGATVLDLAFLINCETALHVEHVYLNNRQKPMQLNRILRPGDAIRFTYCDTNAPKFSWLNLVKTKLAKDTLIQYFERTYQVD